MINKIKRKAAAKAMGISDKQMAELESMQKQIQQISARHEEGNVVVKVTGDMKIDYIEIDGEAREDIKKAANKAFEKVQKETQKKMMGAMGGMGGLMR